MGKAGRPYKDIHISVREFIDMVRFIRSHPVDRTRTKRDTDVPIPDTGKAYWNEALDQILESLKYIQDATPMTSAKRKFHEEKVAKYGDDRIAIYEYIRTKIIEQNGGSSEIYEDRIS